jgi:alpha-tubulin suppressor-like RCC1 family protein
MRRRRAALDRSNPRSAAWSIPVMRTDANAARYGDALLLGAGADGRLGLGQTRDQQRRVATRIGDDDDWQLVVSGQDSSCGIRAAGELSCWGGNSFGNLGLGNTTQRLVPTQAEEGKPDRVWQQVAVLSASAASCCVPAKTTRGSLA